MSAGSVSNRGSVRGPDSKVVVEVADQVATVRINRPEARNALDPESMDQLREAFEQVAADKSVRVLVLTGTGSVFSAGADIRAALAGEQGSFRSSGPSAYADLLAELSDVRIPTIARVQGHVFGGGNGLAAACDLSVAAADARFAFSEVRLGLVPAVVSVVCLPKLSVADATELFLLGDRVPAERVARTGLINACVPRDDLDAQVSRWVHSIRCGGPEAVAGTKRLIRDVRSMDRTSAFEYATAVSGRFFSSAQGREGMTALMGKRPPDWAPAT